MRNPKHLTESESIKQIGNKSRRLIQYRDGGEQFSATSKTISALEAGVYDISTNYDGSCIFSKKEIKTDEILRFEDARQDKTIAEIKKFWGLSEKFEKMGFLHKRGIIVYGNPGTGKSILTKIIMNDIVESGDVVFVAKSPGAARSCLKEFREVEPDRKVVVVFEDMDEIVYMGEHAILELFDGDDSLNHVLFLGTTNYIDRIPPRILRPGRFDRKIPIGNPPASGRKAYFEKKLKGKVEDSVIDDLVEKTDDFSFAELKELLVSIYCLEEGIDEAITNLKGRSYNKFSKISESKLESVIQARPSKRLLTESKVKKKLL